jgi:hypothetical protein
MCNVLIAHKISIQPQVLIYRRILTIVYDSNISGNSFPCIVFCEIVYLNIAVE